ncbi:unnamed protein product [Mycena citricolor]|uniref:Novel STAND NTPase 1 domain-containing protein n=1 Tax=Mycena citricolor TaxID=2018698 RepID=A0AAD2H7D8_9AGAR|nr:unnamed protein product [Mycena citricolor]
MPLALRRASKKDRALQYGAVACAFLKDVGNASNQPYLQVMASVALVIMETVLRVQNNKDACERMTERAYELVCAVVNICCDSETELSPAIIRSIVQFTETLEKILTFVRSQVRGGLWRQVFHSMDDAALITDCNAGLKHALDVFGVQSGIIAAMTMAEMQKDATLRHEELVAILKEKRSKRNPARADDAAPLDESPRKRRPANIEVPSGIISMLPASPKIFYGREAELKHVVEAITASQPARVSICGPEGIGKTAIALTASHHPKVSAIFGSRRFFIECAGANNPKHLVAGISQCLGLQGASRKRVIRYLVSLAAEKMPILLVLDGLETVWKPHKHRDDVEDFLSLLVDIKELTLIVTIRGSERPRQVLWTRPFLRTLDPLNDSAARDTFLDISDVSPDDDSLTELLSFTENNPAVLTRLAGLASFEGCPSLVARWHAEGPALLLDQKNCVVSGPTGISDGPTDEPEEMDADCDQITRVGSQSSVRSGSFGDDNVEAIDSTITILEGPLTEEPEDFEMTTSIPARSSDTTTRAGSVVSPKSSVFFAEPMVDERDEWWDGEMTRSGTPVDDKAQMLRYLIEDLTPLLRKHQRTPSIESLLFSIDRDDVLVEITAN